MVRFSSWCVAGLLLVTAACGDDGETGGAATDAPGATESGAADSSGAEAISYARDVQPIFARHGCIVCHHDGSAIDVDIADPFSAPNGLVGSANTWAEAHPEGNTPALNVEPGQPAESFLLDKLVSPYEADPGVAGGPMPRNIERITGQELADLRDWIDAGAEDDAMFEELIRPIFGDETTLGRRSGKCTWCHHSFPGGQRPNLTNPFDPETGAVGVPSLFDASQMVIEPGDASASVLVLKVEAAEAGPLGGPMPPTFEPLDEAELEVVRSWIAAGAADN